MKRNWLAISTMAASLVIPCGLTTAKAYAAAPAGVSAAQEGRWDDAPSEFNEARRQGFHEGIEAARRDFEERRHKDADDHRMYKRPPVERELVADYREGFRSGYERAMQHMRDDHHDRDRDHDDMPH